MKIFSSLFTKKDQHNNSIWKTSLMMVAILVQSSYPMVIRMVKLLSQFLYFLLLFFLTNDENIGIYGYINSWILRIYQDISKNMNENFEKKYWCMKINQNLKKW